MQNCQGLELTWDPNGSPNRLWNQKEIGKIFQNARKNLACRGEYFWRLLVPLGRLWLHFGRHLNQLGPKGLLKCTRRTRERTQRVPGRAKGSKKTPKGTKKRAEGYERKPKGAKRKPKGSPRDPKRAPRGAKGRQKAAKREAKGD